jgi:hypothetical protein
MKLKSVEINDLLFRRPGITKIMFTADYGTVKRRGAVIYDTVAMKFLTNTSEIVLLAELGLALRKPHIASSSDR